MKIKVLDCRYHRNGVAGRGFYALSFTEGRGAQRKAFLAAVFDTPGDVAVLTASGSAAQRWRGDYYEPALRAAIAKAAADGSAYKH